MSKKSRAGTAVTFVVACMLFLAGCNMINKEKPSFSGYSDIAELATIECYYHNVAELRDGGTDILPLGVVNIGYKKAWYEYDASVSFGIDASKVQIEGPDENGVVTVTIPRARLLSVSDIKPDSYVEACSETGILTTITIEDEQGAVREAQKNMRETAARDVRLLARADDRARTLLEEYVKRVGEAVEEDYRVEFVELPEDESHNDNAPQAEESSSQSNDSNIDDAIIQISDENGD